MQGERCAAFAADVALCLERSVGGVRRLEGGRRLGASHGWCGFTGIEEAGVEVGMWMGRLGGRRRVAVGVTVNVLSSL